MLFKAVIKPKQPYQTELKSTTIYGAMCCAIADMQEYGSKVLEELVFNNVDSLVVSNAYPSGYIVAPEFKNTSEDYIMETESGEIVAFNSNKTVIEHCMINRNNNNSIKHWRDEVDYSDSPLDIYIYSEVFTKEDIEKILRITLLKGLGRRRSVGYGQFELMELTEIDRIVSGSVELGKRDKKSNTYYMVISDYIPDKDDSTNGVYSAKVVRGKTVAGDVKKPIYVINAGGCFIDAKRDKSIFTIGRVVHDENTNTYTCGRAIAIRVSIE